MKEQIIGIAVLFVIGIICLFAYYSAVKQEKSHRYGKDFFADVNIGMGIVIAPILAIVCFGASIIGVITIIFTK